MMGQVTYSLYVAYSRPILEPYIQPTRLNGGEVVDSSIVYSQLQAKW